jgi:hypothetical protein
VISQRVVDWVVLLGSLAALAALAYTLLKGTVL